MGPAGVNPTLLSSSASSVMRFLALLWSLASTSGRVHDAPNPIASASRLARKMEAIFNCSPAAFARLAAQACARRCTFVAGKSVQVSRLATRLRAVLVGRRYVLPIDARW